MKFCSPLDTVSLIALSVMCCWSSGP